MIPALLILALTVDPGGDAEDVLAAADRAAQAHDFERAADLCLDLVAQENADALVRQDALQASLGYADLAYEATGTPEALCRAYRSLVEHGRGDVLDLKPAIEERLESIAGPSWRVSCLDEPEESSEVHENNERDRPARPAVPPNPVRTPIEASSSALLNTTPTDDASPPPRSALTTSGAVLVSTGAASLVGMSATLIVWNNNRARIDAITASTKAGAPKTPETDAEVARLADSENYLRPLAITTGALGAVAVITGAALLIAGHKRSREIAVAPAFTRAFVGLTLSARF